MPVFCYTFVADGAGFGREIQIGKSTLDVSRVVRADKDTLVADFLQLPQARVGRDRLGRDGRWSSESDGAAETGQCLVVVATADNVEQRSSCIPADRKSRG